MNSEALPAFDEIEEGWISCHLYYHQGLSRVLRGFVHPLVASLVKAAWIEAFFFVRYGLGGPHIRLRLRATAGSRDYVLKEAQRFAQDFLESTPSTKSLDEEVIRRSNEYILAADPHDIDDSVYPDNSFRLIPFRPEIERYGGPSLFRASLDFFTLSSVAALEFFSKHGNAARSTQLAHAFRLLLQQALGFAAHEIELCDLLRYGVDSMGEDMPAILEKGDRVARYQRDTFLQIFQRSLAGVHFLQVGGDSFEGASGLLVTGSRRLSAAIGFADYEARAWIGGSQLHMTASRLGLSNAEEVYLSRLLTVTLAAVQATAGESLSWLGKKTREAATAVDADKALDGLLSPALAALVDIPAGQDLQQ